MGKQGASVPSTRMIIEFWPAWQFHCCTLSRMKSLVSFKRWAEFTILYPWRFLSMSQSISASTFGKSSGVMKVLFSSRSRLRQLHRTASL